MLCFIERKFMYPTVLIAGHTRSASLLNCERKIFIQVTQFSLICARQSSEVEDI